MHASEVDFDEWGVDNADHLARRVRLFIAHGPLRGLRLIEVEVIGSVVVLSGQVATLHQKQLATEFARRVAGVGEVRNRIEVDGSWKGQKLQRLHGLNRQTSENETVHRRPS